MGWFSKSSIAPQTHEVWEDDGRHVTITYEEAQAGKADGTLEFAGLHSRAPSGGVGQDITVYRYVRIG